MASMIFAGGVELKSTADLQLKRTDVRAGNPGDSHEDTDARTRRCNSARSSFTPRPAGAEIINGFEERRERPGGSSFGGSRSIFVSATRKGFSTSALEYRPSSPRRM